MLCVHSIFVLPYSAKKCLLLLSLIYIKRLFRLVLNYAKFRILLLFILSGGKTYLYLFQCLTN